MYKDYFHLNEMPFSIAPDPRFLFMSNRHREAMAHLLYGMQGEGGIVLLTGEVGTGKTTLCRNLLAQLPSNVDMAYILNPSMNVRELLQAICEEYHINIPSGRPGLKTLIDALNAHLLAAHAKGRHAILMVDEAQNLGPLVIEQLRLLTNLETNTRKLLQIFLVGQPELQTILSRPDMRQVSQRIIARYHLTHLNKSEVQAYIAHRLRIAGASPLIFPDVLIKRICRNSGGVPRLINLICDRALLVTYVRQKPHVTKSILKQAIKEVITTDPARRQFWLISAGLMLTASFIFTSFAVKNRNPLVDWVRSAYTGASTKSNALETTPLIAAENSPVERASATTVLSSSTHSYSAHVIEDDSEASAYRFLFKLYGINIDLHPGDSSCPLAEVTNIHCYDGHGGLADLFLLDQPVLLRLFSDDGKKSFAILIAIDRKSVTLLVDGVSRQLSLNDLANKWSGQFIAILKIPPDFSGEILPLQRGQAVTWLRQMMEITDGIRSDGSDLYDDELARRVRIFQLTEGIESNGIVDATTVIRLNVRNGKGAPPLFTNSKN
jgi:general secretion pathway protein A